jgi:hypothetical protein
MGASRPQAKGAGRYRVVCYEELAGAGWRVLLDATGEGYVAAVGTISGSTLTGEIAGAGPRATQAHLELLIASDPEIGQASAGPR